MRDAAGPTRRNPFQPRQHGSTCVEFLLDMAPRFTETHRFPSTVSSKFADRSQDSWTAAGADGCCRAIMRRFRRVAPAARRRSWCVASPATDDRPAAAQNLSDLDHRHRSFGRYGGRACRKPRHHVGVVPSVSNAWAQSSWQNQRRAGPLFLAAEFPMSRRGLAEASELP
jgi:hypothetical protein